MKTQLTTEQKARVFAMYYGCPFTDEGWKETRAMLYPTECPDTVQLALRPLSAITDEDAESLAKVMCDYWDENNRVSFIGMRKPEWANLYHESIFCIEVEGFINFPGDSRFYKSGMIEIDTEDSTLNYSRYEEDGKVLKDDYCFNTGLAYQFLIQRGYAVPLFIAPGHPLNGKTAIELGLAIEITNA